MYRPAVSEAVYERATTTLSNTIRNVGKMAARRECLKANPEQRLRVDTDTLKKILPYVAFRCHPNCSIALDTAITGSDIDRGVVITETATDLDFKERFVSELRQQGFRAYTQETVDALESESDRDAYWNAKGAVIKFRTIQEVEESISAQPLHQDNLAIIAGWEVGNILPTYH